MQLKDEHDAYLALHDHSDGERGRGIVVVHVFLVACLHHAGRHCLLRGHVPHLDCRPINSNN